MKTARIIATLTILAALAFYWFGLPALLLPTDGFVKDEIPSRTSYMIALWMIGYLYMGIQGAYFLLMHIWRER